MKKGLLSVAALLATVVAPAMVINTIVGFFIFKIMKKILENFN